MKIKLKVMIRSFLVSALLPFAGLSIAADTTIATVNGIKVSGDLLEFLVANNVAQGLKDTPELRAVLKKELISREVLVQEAKKQNLDKEQALQMQLLMQQNSLLIDKLMAKQFANLNITDEMLRTEYKRQVDQLGDAEQYQVSHIVTATEVEAKAVLKELNAKKGPTFAKLAREKSIHVSAQNAGSLGWLLPSQIAPALAGAVVNLGVGNTTNTPISTSDGWQVLKVEGKRKFKVPSFEESKQQLATAVYTKERTEYVQKLVNAAKVD